MQRCLHMSPAYPEANTPTIIDAGVSESTLHLALGNRCISVGDKAQIANSTLRALSDLGIAYLSTRSMERDHIDVDFARSVGIRAVRDGREHLLKCLELVATDEAAAPDYSVGSEGSDRMCRVLAEYQCGADGAESSNAVDHFFEPFRSSRVHIKDEAVFAGNPVDAVDLRQLLELDERGRDLLVCGLEPNDGVCGESQTSRRHSSAVSSDVAGVLEFAQASGDRWL